MDVIELNNIGEDQTEQERAEQAKWAEKEETSLNEKTDADYDNIRSRSNSETPTQDDADLNDSEDLGRRVRNKLDKSSEKRRGAIKALESATGVRFNMSYGENTRRLIDLTSGWEYDEDSKLLTKLKFDKKDVIITKKGEINKVATKKNKQIWEAIAAANEEYKKSFDSIANESMGFSLSDEALDSVRKDFVDSTEDLMWDMYGVIRERDLDGNTEREIRGIPYADENIDYDNLEDPNQKILYDSKIASLKKDIKHWEDLGKNEQDPTKKLLFNTAKELCIAKKSLMEANANQRPESEEAQERLQEEAEGNDLTRFERFKRWAKENLVGVSAISVAGIITTVVIAGRSAVKKGAKAVGQFGKALADIAKKAAPVIATILNIIAQALTWGAKALEFLSRNLWDRSIVLNVPVV